MIKNILKGSQDSKTMTYNIFIIYNKLTNNLGLIWVIFLAKQS